MPWLETVPLQERLQFVHDAMSDRFTMSERCARYGVSRRIGYKWLARYEAEGRRGLADRSRAPHHCPHRISDHIAELLCTARREHPHWGARKLPKILTARHTRLRAWPAPGTAADLLARRGLVQKRRSRRPRQHPGVVRPTTAASNNLWTADVKGQFRTGDRQYCYPLSIADQHTRCLLACHGLLSTKSVTARPVFERAFREHGLPLAIRTDNGVPCATQQRNFDAFRQEYNEERPHERLGQETPASHYHGSPRPYPTRLSPLAYPGHFLVRKITTGGTFRFRSRLLYLANARTPSGS